MTFSVATSISKVIMRMSFPWLVLIFLLTASQPTLLAQCTSCPSDNGCDGQSGFDTQCSFPKGNDPTCTFYNPDFCKYPSTGCPSTENFDGSCCERTVSPIIIDLSGEGFHLSDPQRGVWFRPFPAVSSQFMVAWPVQGSRNGWLVLDRNGNGLIDDFGELFGNETPQPLPMAGKSRNGFAALAVYDSPDQGGNGDGWISNADQIYTKLRVWTDDNHDGVSQPSELHTLDSLGITAISLAYETARRIDQYGNVFRYRSTIRDTSGNEAAKVIYDVFLVVGAERAANGAHQWPKGLPVVDFTPASATKP